MPWAVVIPETSAVDRVVRYFLATYRWGSCHTCRRSGTLRSAVLAPTIMQRNAWSYEADFAEALFRGNVRFPCFTSDSCPSPSGPNRSFPRHYRARRPSTTQPLPPEHPSPPDSFHPSSTRLNYTPEHFPCIAAITTTYRPVDTKRRVNRSGE